MSTRLDWAYLLAEYLEKIEEYFRVVEALHQHQEGDGANAAVQRVVQANLTFKGCEEKHFNTTAHHPVVKPPAAASHESVAHSD